MPTRKPVASAKIPIPILPNMFVCFVCFVSFVCVGGWWNFAAFIAFGFSLPPHPPYPCLALPIPNSQFPIANSQLPIAKVVSAYLLLSSVISGSTIAPSLGIAACYFYPPFVLPAVATFCFATMLYHLASSRSLPTVVVNMTPELPSPPEKVDNEFRIDSIEGAVLCVNPCRNEVLGELPALNAAQVDEVVQKATRAQKLWQKTSFEERRRVLKTMQRWILDHPEEIVELCCLDSGKSRVGIGWVW